LTNASSGSDHGRRASRSRGFCDCTATSQHTPALRRFGPNDHSDDILIFTDASTQGFGVAVIVNGIQKAEIFVELPRHIDKPTPKTMFRYELAIAVAARLAVARASRGRRISFCDNSAAVGMVRRMRALDPVCLKALQLLSHESRSFRMEEDWRWVHTWQQIADPPSRKMVRKKKMGG